MLITSLRPHEAVKVGTVWFMKVESAVMSLRSWSHVIVLDQWCALREPGSQNVAMPSIRKATQKADISLVSPPAGLLLTLHSHTNKGFRAWMRRCFLRIQTCFPKMNSVGVNLVWRILMHSYNVGNQRA